MNPYALTTVIILYSPSRFSSKTINVNVMVPLSSSRQSTEYARTQFSQYLLISVTEVFFSVAVVIITLLRTLRVVITVIKRAASSRIRLNNRNTTNKKGNDICQMKDVSNRPRCRRVTSVTLEQNPKVKKKKMVTAQSLTVSYEMGFEKNSIVTRNVINLSNYPEIQQQSYFVPIELDPN